MSLKGLSLPQIRCSTWFCCDWRWKGVWHTSPVSLLLYPFLHLSSFPLYKLPPSSQPVFLTCLQAQYKFPLLRCRSLNPRKMCGTSFMIVFNHFVLALMAFIISISVKCLFIRSQIHDSVLNLIQQFGPSFHLNVSASRPRFQSVRATRAIINHSLLNPKINLIGHSNLQCA